MKILLVSEFFPTNSDLNFSGGVEARNFYIAKNLSKRHEITVITSRIKQTKAIEKMYGFSVIRVGPPRDYQAVSGDFLNRLIFIFSAIKTGSKLDIEIVDGSNFITHFVAKIISVFKRVPVVAWYPDVWIGAWIKNAGVSGSFGEILERLNLLLGFDHFIAISGNTRKKLKVHTKQKITVIYCGIDRTEFKLSKTTEMPVIISIARLAPYKNLITLLRAFIRVRSKVDGAKLVIVGTGPEKAELLKFVCANHLIKHVRFVSNLKRAVLIRLLKKAKVFSLPSLVEGFGIATIEAMASGLPYVNSDIAIHREILKNGQGGYLVNPSTDDYSIKLIKLLTESNIYYKKRLDAVRLASHYDWQEISQKTERVYKSLL